MLYGSPTWLCVCKGHLCLYPPPSSHTSAILTPMTKLKLTTRCTSLHHVTATSKWNTDYTWKESTFHCSSPHSCYYFCSLFPTYTPSLSSAFNDLSEYLTTMHATFSNECKLMHHTNKQWYSIYYTGIGVCIYVHMCIFWMSVDILQTIL